MRHSLRAVPFFFPESGVRTRFLLTVLLLALLRPLSALSTCAAYPAGQGTRDEPSALSFEQTWLEMLLAKNTAALDCMLAPDFADTSRTGSLRPKQLVLRELTAHREQDEYQQKLTELKATLFGDTAVVRGINVISDHAGREVLRIRFTDVLWFTDKHWIAVSAQETDEKPR